MSLKTKRMTDSKEYYEALRKAFDNKAFIRGMDAVDDAIKDSPLLSAFAPIKIVASASCVVEHLPGNLHATEHAGYFLDPQPFGDKQVEVEAELKVIIQRVAMTLGDKDREVHHDCNVIFLARVEDPADVYSLSIEQGKVIYRGKNIILYEASWKWKLVTKMKLLQKEYPHVKPGLMKECVKILSTTMALTRDVVDRGVLRDFDDRDGKPPISDETIDKVDEEHRKEWGFKAFSTKPTDESG